MKVAITSQVVKSLRFSECIRTSLSDVSVFSHGWSTTVDIPLAALINIALPSPSQRPTTLYQSQVVMDTQITLSFASDVVWDLGSLSSGIVDWLKGSQELETSKVGTLSSPNFAELIRAFVGPRFSSDFRQMMYATSLANNQRNYQWHDEIGFQELQHIGALAGNNILAELDRGLCPQKLTRYSKHELESLFLVIFGTILAVGYAYPTGTTPIFPPQDVSFQF